MANTDDICDCITEGQVPSGRNLQIQMAQVLCGLLSGSRSQTMQLCEPGTGAIVFVRYSFNSEGGVGSYSAFYTNGDPYMGNVDNLQSC